jgi:hypothetical protein
MSWVGPKKKYGKPNYRSTIKLVGTDHFCPNPVPGGNLALQIVGVSKIEPINYAYESRGIQI